MDVFRRLINLFQMGFTQEVYILTYGVYGKYFIWKKDHTKMKYVSDEIPYNLFVIWLMFQAVLKNI